MANLIYPPSNSSAGASITASPFRRPTTCRGGILFGPGLKVIFNNSTGFLRSLGYRPRRTDTEPHPHR